MTSKHVSNDSVILLTALVTCVLLSQAPRMQAQQLATLSVLSLILPTESFPGHR